MASFIGRSGYHLLFTEGDSGVVVDSRVSVVVASGTSSTLEASRTWEAGEFTQTDEVSAEAGLSAFAFAEPQATPRMYTIPRGVRNAARLGLESFAARPVGGSSVALLTARTLATEAQIDFAHLSNIVDFFKRHADDKVGLTADGSPTSGEVAQRLYGGDAARRWATTIVDREPASIVQHAPDWQEVSEILEENPEASPEFIIRLDLEDGAIDRLYKIDIDHSTYVWDDTLWTSLNLQTPTIWSIDNALDGPASSTSGYSHLVVDAESAIQIAELLVVNPFDPVWADDLDLGESRLVRGAIQSEDWELVDSVVATAGTPGDGVYTEDERSANASKQVRDSKGLFAKQGGRVIVNDDPSQAGKIDRVNQNGTIDVRMDSGGVQTILGNQITGVSPQFVAQIPGETEDIPRVDFSGILAEPRTPVNRDVAQIPGTLPQMTAKDLHGVINNFPAWVKAQRESFKPAASPGARGVLKKDSLDKGASGRALENTVGKTLTTDAYSNSLISEWLKRKNSKGNQSNKLWYQPITAASDEVEDAVQAAPMDAVDSESAPAEEGTDGSLTPQSSDVEPVYLAVVAPDDPRAVLKLISLVPATASSTQPVAYKRDSGKWVQDEQVMNTLTSATPPPVIPLTDDALNDVLVQVDSAQEQSKTKTKESQYLGESPAPGFEGDTDSEPAEEVEAPEEPVAASAYDHGLMVLWGPRKDIMDAAVTADGGLDRNRGGAEKLRHYWTKGPGALKIVWGTPGDWTRCVANLSKYMGPRAKGYCSLRHHEVTGMWTGDKKHREMFSALSGETEFSDDLILDYEEALTASVDRTRGEMARLRMRGLTASGEPKYNIYDTSTPKGLTAAASVIPSLNPLGAAFFIPLALPEGISSGDGRLVDKYAATIRNLPISLLWQIKTDDGHKGSVVVGLIERLGRTPLGIGGGYGHFDVGVYGAEAERMVRNGMLRFVSADMDNFEADEEPEEAAAEEEDVKSIRQRKMTISQSRVMAVTIVAKPAFQEATIQLVPEAVLQEDNMIPDGIYVDGNDPREEEALVACAFIANAIPITPPQEWFTNPSLSAPTPLTVTDDGKVFGHIAAWDSNHIGREFKTNPPHSPSNYAYFHSGVVRTEEGEDVPVGQLTLAGGHAGMSASAREAARHYDDTASSVADIHAGEDAYGIWVAGAVRPGTSPEQIRALRASAPSGDWRPIRGKLELVAVCQVNVPGFPIARTLVASGQIMSLVAAGAMSLAKLKEDPLDELSARLEKLEQFSNKELSLQASAARERMTGARAARDAELSARTEAVLDRMSEFGYVSAKSRREAAAEGQELPNASFRSSANGTDTNSVNELRERIARTTEFASTTKEIEERKIRELLEARGQSAPEDPEDTPDAEENREKYTPKNQPRDDQGQFRLVLARIKDNLGTSSNQSVIDKLKETEGYEGVGDYAGSVKSGLDLIETLNRLDTGALNSDALANVRSATTDLGKVLANLPLPFGEEAEKVRFSDLPPVLRDLIDDFIVRVTKKIGAEDAEPAVAELEAFKTGADLFSQSEISSQMNKLLRLLT